MSFHPHTGGLLSGFIALPMTTFDTILDSIVADVAAAIAAGKANGWTLHDDQRAPAGIVVVPVCHGGHNTPANPNATLTAGATALVVAAPSRIGRHWLPGVTEINVSSGTPLFTPSGAWGTVSAIASDTAATMAVGWPNATLIAAASRTMIEKAFGFVVLKCTSAQKNFYVRIIRPKSYADALRYDVWETWDAATHTGTNPSNQEILRAYDTRFTGAKQLQYILWLMPDSIGLWAGADPGNITGTNYWDLFYAGNMSPVRAGDSNALVHGCSNQELSGWAPASSSGALITDSDGSMQVLREVGAGSVWQALPSSFTPLPALATFSPRAPIYCEDPYRPLLDDTNRLAMSEIDIYQAGGRAYGGNNEGRRGAMRYFRVPCGNPSNNHLVTFGPAEDGRIYVLVRASYPFWRGSANTLTFDTNSSNSYPATAFGWGYRAPNYNEVSSGITAFYAISRWFLLPVDL